MTYFDYCFVLIVLILCYWIIQLKSEVRRLSDEISHQPPEPPQLSVHDIQMLQASMAELVEEVEQYTESQMRKMNTQAVTIQTLCARLDEKIRFLDQQTAPPPPPPTPQPVSSTRVVPLSPRQGFSNHKDRDRIIELYRQGWPPEKIAEELRITKGEVQLVVNLA